MKVTIKDIAKAAGVSPSTVSRALQGNPRISPEVRARVRQIAQEMNFHPNQMARSLVSRQTRIIGIVFPDEAGMNLGNPFYPAVLQGLGHVASEKGYQMLLITGGAGMTAMQSGLAAADGGYVGGLVLLTAGADTPAQTDVPMVVIGHPADDGSLCCVDNDNVQLGCEATKFLLESGHQRILLLGYDERFMFTAQRREGYGKALREAGIAVREDWIVSGRPDEAAQLMALFRQADRPTAVVCMDDTMAIGLSRLLSSVGLNVPEDVSLISFNNTESSSYHTPPLTTFDVDPYQLGASAMKLMIGVITGEITAPVSINVPYRFIPRQSVVTISKKEN